MKKSAIPAALLLLGVLVSGCPVYDADDVGCFSDVDCPDSYVCDDSSDTCVAVTPVQPSVACSRPDDCGTNETCSKSGICSTGDCHFSSVGCVSGYECSPQSGRWECVKEGSSGEGAGGQGGVPAMGGVPAIGGEPGASAGAAADAGATSGGMTSAAGNGG